MQATLADSFLADLEDLSDDDHDEVCACLFALIDKAHVEPLFLSSYGNVEFRTL